MRTSIWLAAVLLLSLVACSRDEPAAPAMEEATVVAAMQSAAPVERADMVFTNGKVYTVNPEQPWADSVAVRGNEIVYVGDSEGAMDFVGEGTTTADLGGRLLLPGFIESHIHTTIGAATTSGVILDTTDSVEQVLAKVKAYADENPELPVIFGASYLAGLFDARGPNKVMLDEIVPDRPVYLMDHTLHSVWVNSRALEMAGITRDTPDPPGGEYVRYETGEATGAVRGGPAHAPIAVATGAITAESMSKAMPDVFEGLSEFGFTAAIDMGAPIATDAAYEALYSLSKREELPLRMSVTFYVNTPDLAQVGVQKLEEYARKYRTDTLWFDTLKISGDSVVENQKAAVLDPYLSTGEHGSLYFTREELANMAIEAAKLGYGTTIHTIGDAAARAALQAVAGLELKELPRNRGGAICCAGNWLACNQATKRIQTDLLRAAAATGSEALVTACPKCMIHLKCAQSGDDPAVPDLEIRDLAAVVAGALTKQGACPSGREPERR